MAKAYQINDHYGVVLVDSGKIIPLSNCGPIDAKDPEVLLELLLTAAVELDHLRSQLGSGEEDAESPGPTALAYPQLRADQSASP